MLLSLFCCTHFSISDVILPIIFNQIITRLQVMLMGNLHLTINRGKIPISTLFGNLSTFTQNMLNAECSSPRSACSLTNRSSSALASYFYSQEYKYGQPFLLKDCHTQIPIRFRVIMLFLFNINKKNMNY